METVHYVIIILLILILMYQMSDYATVFATGYVAGYTNCAKQGNVPEKFTNTGMPMMNPFNM